MAQNMYCHSKREEWEDHERISGLKQHQHSSPRKNSKSCSSMFTAKGFRWIYPSSFSACNTYLFVRLVLVCECSSLWQISHGSGIFNILASPLTSTFHSTQFHTVASQGLIVLIHMHGLCNSQKPWRKIPWPLHSFWLWSQTTWILYCQVQCSLGLNASS